MAQIHEQMVKVMQAVSHVAKRDRNTQQGFNFRGIDSVLNAVGPAFREHGVFVQPNILNVDTFDVRVGKNNLPGYRTIVRVSYAFVAADGSSIAVEISGEAVDTGDKSLSKALSMAFKYALLQTLALPTDEPDPDATSHETVGPRLVNTPTEAQRVAAGMADQVRTKILEWANSNGVAPAAIAARFANEMGQPIQNANIEALNNFYAQLALNAEVVGQEPHEPATVA